MHGDKDLHHLKLLSIAYYVVAVLVALYAAYSLWSLFSYLAFLTRLSGNRNGFEVSRLFFVIWSFGWTCYFFALAACMVVAGKKLQSQTSLNFCLIVAIGSLPFIPLGTALGVLTLIVLLRPSVRALFESPLAEREARRLATQSPGMTVSTASAAVFALDSVYGVGHALAANRTFNPQMDLGKLVFQCPRNPPDEIKQRQMGSTGALVGGAFIIGVGTLVISALLTIPLIKFLKLANGAPLTVAILMGGWLSVLVLFFIGIAFVHRRFRRSGPWELNVHELGLELKSPKVHLRARYEHISDIQFGPKVNFLNIWFLLPGLLTSPLWTIAMIPMLRDLHLNMLKVRMVDGTVFCIPNAKVIFREDSLNAIIQRFWLTRPVPRAPANPPRTFGPIRNSQQP